MSWGQAYRLFLSRPTIVSAIVSVTAWGLIWGWQSAVVFVLLLYVHEAGHMLAALWRRVQLLSGPLFIPGLGAFVTFSSGASAWSDVVVSLAGPIIGGLASALVKVLALQTGMRDVAFAAEMALIVNMVNLAPVAPFDGSRVFARLGKLALIPVCIASAAFVFTFTRQDLLSSLLIGVAVFAMVRSRQVTAPVSWLSRAGILCVYVAGVALLLRLHDATGGTARLLQGRDLDLLASRTAILGVPVGPAVMGMAALVIFSFAITGFAWRPERSGRTRYLLTALFGWPHYLLFTEAWRLKASLMLGAEVFGLPGLLWLKREVESRARRGDALAGVFAAWAFDYLWRDGRRADAEAWFESVEPSLRQTNIAAPERFALCLKQIGDGAAGHRLVARSYLRRHPDPTLTSHTLPLWSNNAAYRLLQEGRPDMALPFAIHAFRAEPKHGCFADTLGCALLASGKPAEAEEKLRLGQLDSHHAGHGHAPFVSGRAALGRALTEQGRLTEGLKELEAALSATDLPWPEDDVPSRATAERWREEARSAIEGMERAVADRRDPLAPPAT
jgi:tetratricopeptide (TPR) repeat protein